MFIIIKKTILKMASFLVGKSIIQIASYLERSDSIISFDVFDTLVIRSVKKPVDVFDNLDGHADFKQKRINAERKARGEAKAEEITIKDIYEQLYPDDPILREEFLKKEIQRELEVCQANDEMLSLFNALLTQGKKIIIVSDMYLPQKVICEILSNCGYDLTDIPIYISSEFSLTKRTGNLIKKVIETEGTKDLVHIGDNLLTDYIMPRKMGIKSLLYEKSKTLVAENDTANSLKYIAFLHSQLHLNALMAYIIDSIEDDCKDKTEANEEIIKKDSKSYVGEIHIIRDQKEGYLISKKDCDIFRAKVIFDDPIPESVSGRIKYHFDNIFYYYVLKKRAFGNGKNSSMICFYPNANGIRDAKTIEKYRRSIGADRIKMVLLEEGIGTYIRDADRWAKRGSEKLHGVKKALKILRSNLFARIGANRVIELFKSSGDIEYFGILSKQKNAEYIPNTEVCRKFEGVFRLRAKAFHERVDYKNTIIVNTQLVFDEFDNDADTICLKKIKKICDEKNIRLLIKPHPREKHLERYSGLEVDKNYQGVSQEILIAKSENKPLMIIGFFSTTLVTGKLFFDIPALCLADLVDCSGVGEYATDIHSFANTFRNVLLLPKSYEDVERIIETRIMEY